NIVEYQIFQIKDSQFEHLYTTDSNTFVYRHRKISKSEDYIYAVKAITYDGKESIPAYVTVKGSDE
ncbi:MAG: hypothetical protein KAS97_05115, partial [Candidatus Aminicenantes bacterium]|nr:hypothetical protein [Candidatus Aminicenantes bacterium]